MSVKTSVEKLKLQSSGLTWININHPTEKETKNLHRTFKFHHLDLEDCLSENQRPKIDDYDDYLFIVLHSPKKVGRQRHVNASEIDIFISQNYLITLHQDNAILKKVFEKCKKNKGIKEEYMGKGAGYFLYMLTNDLFASGFPLMDELSKQLDELEKDVFDHDYSKDRLKDILLLKKDIINFRRIIMPERSIMAQLEHKNKKFLPENLDVYFDDIVDMIEKMWNNLENLQELVDSLQETNESIISHNTNNVIKILTIFSVILLPMTLLTGFYGMNLQGLPFAGEEASVLIVGGIILGIGALMLGYFKYKKWV